MTSQTESKTYWIVHKGIKYTEGSFIGYYYRTKEEAQKKLNEANKEIDTLVGTRTRMMISKLKNIEGLPQGVSEDFIEGGSELLELDGSED